MLVDSPLEVLLQHIILFYLEVNGQFPWLMSKASYILIRVCSILNIWNCSFLAEVEVRLFLVSNVLTRNNNRATWDMIKIQSVKYNLLCLFSDILIKQKALPVTREFLHTWWPEDWNDFLNILLFLSSHVFS